MKKQIYRVWSTGYRALQTVMQSISSTFYPLPSTNFGRGFTLIETLVAVTVLLLSLSGPLSIAAQSMYVAQYSREQIVAFYLAQEAIEYVRSVRDRQFLAGGDSWANTVNALSTCAGNGCRIDFPEFRHEPCAGGVCEPLRRSPSGVYNHFMQVSPNTPSPYTRRVIITPVSIQGGQDALSVRVIMSWASGRNNRSIELKTFLFNYNWL